LYTCSNVQLFTTTFGLYWHILVSSTEPRFELVGNVPDPSFGRVNVHMKQVWGEICSDGWTNTEADVFCKTLGRGFKGGIAMYEEHQSGVPVLISEITCQGNETNFNSCIVGDYFLCQSAKQAGVLCYKDSRKFVK